MKIVVVWIAGCLLLCAATAAGYYVGKTERGDADRNEFTRNIVEGETGTAEVLNSANAPVDSKKIITFDLGSYILARENPPASPVHRSDRQCVGADDEALIQLGSALTVFENCRRVRARP